MIVGRKDNNLLQCTTAFHVHTRLQQHMHLGMLWQSSHLLFVLFIMDIHMREAKWVNQFMGYCGWTLLGNDDVRIPPPPGRGEEWTDGRNPFLSLRNHVLTG